MIRRFRPALDPLEDRLPLDASTIPGPDLTGTVAPNPLPFSQLMPDFSVVYFGESMDAEAQFAASEMALPKSIPRDTFDPSQGMEGTW